VNDAVTQVLAELGQWGPAHDAEEPDPRRKLLNITPDTGQLLALLVRATRSRRILELGTSNGYSTLWLAAAACDTGGCVTTVELREAKAMLARETFGRAGIEAVVDLRVADGSVVLDAAADGAHDFIFLDADRDRYLAWWPDLARVLAGGGLLVVDNATSHARELAPFAAAIASVPTFTTVLVPVGNGELLVHKATKPQRDPTAPPV
jgi:predicted O-methyltransferase YrrM